MCVCCVCVCVFVCVCECVCMCVCACVCVYVCVYMCVCPCVCVFVCAECECECVNMCACVHACMCVYPPSKELITVHMKCTFKAILELSCYFVWYRHVAKNFTWGFVWKKCGPHASSNSSPRALNLIILRVHNPHS